MGWEVPAYTADRKAGFLARLRRLDISHMEEGKKEGLQRAHFYLMAFALAVLGTL